MHFDANSEKTVFNTNLFKRLQISPKSPQTYGKHATKCFAYDANAYDAYDASWATTPC